MTFYDQKRTCSKTEEVNIAKLRGITLRIMLALLSVTFLAYMKITPQIASNAHNEALYQLKLVVSDLIQPDCSVTAATQHERLQLSYKRLERTK